MKLTHEVYFSDTKDNFTNSREALKHLLQNEGHEILELKSTLELVNFGNLKNFPQYLTSISHTKGAGAALLAHKSDYLSVGIDIEWSDRPMKDGTQKFYQNPQDSEYPNSLELWAMKEAAFKALSPLGYPGVLVLSKIIIQNGIFWSDERTELRGSVQVQVHEQTAVGKKLNVAIAYISH
ncbi:MAG: hypothetical protein WC635_09310 [Bacteriovorax sp.]|jgi:phosphopantetheinyl transferase (holo-ACP synthase)